MPHHTANHRSHPRKERYGISKGLILAGTLILFLWLLYYNRHFFINWMKQHPLLYSLYQHISLQVTERTLLGLFYAAFFGSLFFITLPIEVIFLYYTLLAYDPLALVAVSLAGVVLGMLTNYAIGWLMGERVLTILLGKFYHKLKRINDRFGTFFVFFGNLIPSPIEPFSVLLGGTRYPLRKFLVYTSAGRLIKFLFLLMGKDYFLQTVFPLVSSWI
ncbi:VTT domain-containing protein [Candidatus Woesearchaeota archaeon]|nr:VTT domain-containing protein [Candidatus Woesearchaeota archaeon]